MSRVTAAEPFVVCGLVTLNFDQISDQSELPEHPIAQDPFGLALIGHCLDTQFCHSRLYAGRNSDLTRT